MIFIKDLGTKRKAGQNRRYALYKCKCGSLKECRVDAVTKSCGCTVGLSKTRLYNIWSGDGYRDMERIYEEI